MSVNIKEKILGYKNDPIVDSEGLELTFGDALLSAANSGGLQTDDTKTKTSRYLLATRIAAAILGDGEIVFTSSEIVMLRESVARIYTPLILGRVTELLDPESMKI